MYLKGEFKVSNRVFSPAAILGTPGVVELRNHTKTWRYLVEFLYFEGLQF